jgi:hypothetical protein
MTRSWERVRGILGREDHSPLRTEAWSSPSHPGSTTLMTKEGTIPRQTLHPIPRPSKPAIRQNAETGTARTKRARRAPIRHGAHEMALAHRSRGAVAAPHGAENWATGGGGLVRAPSATDRQCQQPVRMDLAVLHCRRGSMIATAPSGRAEGASAGNARAWILRRHRRLCPSRRGPESVR